MHAFLGFNALVAGGSFIIAPDGHLIQMPLSNLERSPFTDFLLPGLLLFAFLGVFPMVVAFSLWRLPDWRWPDRINPFKRFHWSWAASLAVGLITMIWIVVQIQWIHPAELHGFVFMWGVLIMLATLLPSVQRYCKRRVP